MKVFDLKSIKAYPFGERHKNVLYDADGFKAANLKEGRCLITEPATLSMRSEDSVRIMRSERS